MTFIFWPDSATADETIGGKARALWNLRSTGLAIPPWFAVTPAAFESSVPEAVRWRLEAGIDGADEAEVAAVWQSAFTARVRAYRSQRGVRSETRAPAVLVQLMVRAACSGVAFGADPVSGRRDRVVVSAVPGLGVGLVQGECEADTWHLDADGRILSRQIARKTSVWRPAEDGVRTEALAPDDGARPALDDARLAAVCRMVQAAGRHFQAPRDVEWAIEGETIQLLQSRPITSLRDVPAESEPYAIWDNSNIVESYAGVTTPLTFSFAQRAYEGVYRQFCRPHKGSVPLSTAEVTPHPEAARPARLSESKWLTSDLWLGWDASLRARQRLPRAGDGPVPDSPETPSRRRRLFETPLEGRTQQQMYSIPIFEWVVRIRQHRGEIVKITLTFG